MLLSRRFINDILRNPILLSKIYAIVVDEAHCISHWGAAFRKKYGTLGVVRAFLPKPTPIIAVSASLTRRVCRDITQKLQFPPTHIYKSLGNDRPNVSIIVRAIHNPLHTYTDLDFLIPASVGQGEDLKKTWIYADNIEVGAEIIDHLRTLIPKHLHGVIRPYNAVHGIDYRTTAMEQFRSGAIRILVCTDAAGMVRHIFKLSRILPQLNTFRNRVVIFQTSTLLFNGNYLENFQALFSVQGVQLEARTPLVWLYFW